ncbi:SLATT domain-containing protein [Microbulbifer variabilis]|uniref:SLATT domain-containing protein n=1 Tax=Microbulbifer variabilis TaxID=266805 RepID=A0ABY4V8A6_9GAMM|nr:SLATT domain-containing protein [Microbulbifer variabilis]USD20500.1 SLATT domain-containing protein [Microbulbifer variabilis]
MSTIPNTVAVLDKLRWNAHLCKHSHFRASMKGRNLHVLCGVPIVVVNLFLGSLFFSLINAELPDWTKWSGAALALLAALLGGVQTFFNFKKNYEGHRQVGNEYLAIARECERLIALYFDRILDLEHLSNKISELNTRYSEINQRAEEFIVSDKVYRQAMQIQSQKASKEPSLVERMRNTSFEEAKIGSQVESSQEPLNS